MESGGTFPREGGNRYWTPLGELVAKFGIYGFSRMGVKVQIIRCVIQFHFDLNSN